MSKDVPSSDASEVWRDFLSLRQVTTAAQAQLQEAYMALVDQQASTQGEPQIDIKTAEREAMEHQRCRAEHLFAELEEARQEKGNLLSSLNVLRSRVAALESEKHEMKVHMSRVEQQNRHLSDRATVAETGRRIAEITAQEHGAALDFASKHVHSLQALVVQADAIKEKALVAQSEKHAVMLRVMSGYYDTRERDLLTYVISTIAILHEKHLQVMRLREAEVAQHWQNTVIITHESQYQNLTRQFATQAEMQRASYQEGIRSLEAQHAAWRSTVDAEIGALRTAIAEREQLFSNAVTRAESQACNAEQRYEAERARAEQVTHAALSVREAEVRTHYERLLSAAQATANLEREALVSSFIQQLQSVTTQHKENEREIERVHREEQSELAQRFRTLLGELQDSRCNLRGATETALCAKTSLIQKIDSIQQRQVERTKLMQTALGDAGSSEAAN